MSAKEVLGLDEATQQRKQEKEKAEAQELREQILRNNPQAATPSERWANFGQF
jgi:hypothetical protein